MKMSLIFKLQMTLKVLGSSFWENSSTFLERREGGKKKRKKTVFIYFRKIQWPSHPHCTQAFMTSYSWPPGPELAVPESCTPRYLPGATSVMGLSCSRLNAKSENWKPLTVAAANMLRKLGKRLTCPFSTVEAQRYEYVLSWEAKFLRKQFPRKLRIKPPIGISIWGKAAKSYPCHYRANFRNLTSLLFKIFLQYYHLGQNQLQA